MDVILLLELLNYALKTMQPISTPSERSFPSKMSFSGHPLCLIERKRFNKITFLNVSTYHILMQQNSRIANRALAYIFCIVLCKSYISFKILMVQCGTIPTCQTDVSSTIFSQKVVMNFPTLIYKFSIS